MSLLNRFQPFALSAFMALTATSCPPERLLSFSRGQGDDGPLACPVRGVAMGGEGPEAVDLAVENLASRGIGPETFHRENLDRLQSLTGVCSASQIGHFDAFQTRISDEVSRTAPAAIGVYLESLYRRAYVYNEADRAMALGNSPAHQDAKRRLDLWVAAVDRRAFEDAAFLERIWGHPKIRSVMALNSPHLSAYDRGELEQTFRAEAGGDEALTRLYNERPLEGIVRQFDWLRTYDGREEKFMEAPFWRSQLEAYVVTDSSFDRERLLRLTQATFPREAVERLMNERGYGASYRRHSSLSAEALLERYHEVAMALSPANRPLSRRRLVEDIQVMGLVFAQRGVDPQKELERRGIDAMVGFGYSREDAALMYRLQTGSAPYTHDRLDDYRARHGLLGEYRDLYRNMLTHSLTEVFSRANRSRYGMWGDIILNRSLTKIPIFLEDLDRVRRDVAGEVGDAIDFGRPGGFETRDTNLPQWFTPSDVGLCGSLTGGPLTLAGLARYQGRTANDLICNNVELMAFLPRDMEVEHALATAIGLFGVITVRNSDMEIVDGTLVPAEWGAGTLMETLAHEASHIDWFRQNFDGDSARLEMLAIDERRAYAMGGAYLRDYAEGGLSRFDETGPLNHRIEFVTAVVDATNRVLGVASGLPRTMEPDYMEPSWDTGNPGRFRFQPGTILQGEAQQRQLAQVFGVPGDREIADAWSSLFLGEMSFLSLTRAEKNEALLALDTLESSSNGADAGFYFLRSHPLTRVVNSMGAQVGLPPFNAIDMSASDWANLKAMVGRRAVDRRNFSLLSHSRPPR